MTLNLFVRQKKQPFPLRTPAHTGGCRGDLMHLLDQHQVPQVHTSPSTLWGESRVLFYRFIQNIRVIPSILSWTVHPSSVWHAVFLKEHFMRSLDHPVLVQQGHLKSWGWRQNPLMLCLVYQKLQKFLLEETKCGWNKSPDFPLIASLEWEQGRDSLSLLIIVAAHP